MITIASLLIILHIIALLCKLNDESGDDDSDEDSSDSDPKESGDGVKLNTKVIILWCHGVNS